MTTPTVLDALLAANAREYTEQRKLELARAFCAVAEAYELRARRGTLISHVMALVVREAGGATIASNLASAHHPWNGTTSPSGT